jgi:hypothetical protein
VLGDVRIQGQNSMRGLKLVGARSERTETVDHNETITIHASGIIAILIGL